LVWHLRGNGSQGVFVPPPLLGGRTLLPSTPGWYKLAVELDVDGCSEAIKPYPPLMLSCCFATQKSKAGTAAFKPGQAGSNGGYSTTISTDQQQRPPYGAAILSSDAPFLLTSDSMPCFATAHQRSVCIAVVQMIFAVLMPDSRNKSNVTAPPYFCF
jgi:hypothetical protein